MTDLLLLALAAGGLVVLAAIVISNPESVAANISSPVWFRRWLAQVGRRMRLACSRAGLVLVPPRPVAPAVLLRRAVQGSLTLALSRYRTVVMPDTVLVRLHPDDVHRLGSEEAAFLADLAAAIFDAAKRRRYECPRPPHCYVVADGEVLIGRPQVGGSYLGFTEDMPAKTIEISAPDGSEQLQVVELTVFISGQPSLTCRLGPGEHALGRDPDHPVTVSDKSVSRTHCLLGVDANLQVCVRDLGSRNGTRIGRQLVGQRDLVWPCDETLELGNRVTCNWTVLHGAPNGETTR